MKTSLFLAILVTTLVVILVSRVSAQTYITLDDPLGVNGTVPLAISGNYVVGHYFDANDNNNVFLYNISTGNYTTIYDPLDAYEILSISISGNYVTGCYLDAYDNYNAFLYNINTGDYTTIDDPFGNNNGFNDETVPTAISGNYVVGYNSAGATYNAFLYNISTGDYTTIDDPFVVYDGLAPSAISVDYVTVYYWDADYNYNGFLYNMSTGGYASLDDPLGANGTVPTAISGNYIVGTYIDADYNYNGFLYNISTGDYTTTHDPLGVNGTHPLDISGNYAVGTYYDANTNANGFLYNISTGVYTTIDDPLGVNGNDAVAISGNYVVMNYYDADNEQHGFLVQLNSVTTQPASNVGNLSATLNGSVNANGLSTATYFEYGTNTTYGSTTPNQNLGSGANFSATISKLAPNTIYDYKAVAVVGGTNYYGNNQTVTTEPSVLALANLSSDVYYSSLTGYAGPPAYNFVGSYDIQGNIGNAYASADNSQIVIAYRGTYTSDYFTLWLNLIVDSGFANGDPSSGLDTYAEAAATFASSVQQTYTNANITLTGHSLGAALAIEVGEASGLTAIGFNGPQSSNVYSAILPKIRSALGPNFRVQSVQNPIIDYRMYGDQVSLAGSPFANQLTYTFATPLDVPQIDSLQTLLANVPFLLNSHYIATMIVAIESNGPPMQGFIGPNWIQLLNSSLPTSISIQNVGLNDYDLSFLANGSTGVLIDPQTSGGSDYVCTVNNGSPDITGIVLPALDGVSSYEMRSETGSTWSNFQPVQPGAQVPFDPVNGIEFVPLDQNGDAVVTTNQVFGIYFDSTNTVSTTFTQSSTTSPLAPVLQIALNGNQMHIAWSTNIPTGFELVSTTNLISPVSWITVTNTPVIVNNQMLVTLPIENQSKYFRLSQ